MTWGKKTNDANRPDSKRTSGHAPESRSRRTWHLMTISHSLSHHGSLVCFSHVLPWSKLLGATTLVICPEEISTDRLFHAFAPNTFLNAEYPETGTRHAAHAHGTRQQ